MQPHERRPAVAAGILMASLAVHGCAASRLIYQFQPVRMGG
jgi:hypothetical protein